MLGIRKDDIVFVTTGKDKGKKGKVLRVLPSLNKAIVENINLVKKNRRKTQQDQQAGIIDIECPISLSNIMLLCKSCNRPTRIGVKINPDAKDRYCKRCKTII
ncbi:MAG: 50S ribosomal protein L24 [Candidatus Omnitrophota bacterium]|nr:50S ribosomal protein L24 [Candidatus Omnitrophota bacterium]